MKQSLRFFSLGLLVSALLLLGYNFFFQDTLTSAELSVEEMTDSLKEQGYRVITEEEFISYTLDNDTTDKKSEDKADEKADEEAEKNTDKEDSKKEEEDEKKDKESESKEDKEEDKVIKASFKTESGVVSEDIADSLVEKKIIKENEHDKFVKYLEDNDYSKYIQLGTFEVSSDMDFKELAETVTTYPGN